MSDRTILIADDDTDLTELLARQCRRLGFRAETANDSNTALGKIVQTRPDVVILDVNMPGGNGLSVREWMATNEPLASIPVIILTGRSDVDTIRRCHKSCAYYVAKCPDVWQRIEPLLHDLLKRRAKSGNPWDKADSVAATDSPYEQSDQKLIFDWMFDLFGDGETDPVEPAVEAPSTKPGESPWILCIDDDSEFSLGLQLRLQEHGVEVLRAFGGTEGYRHAFTCGPRVILLDYEMPNGNGDYVLRRLKENPATRHVPVIVLTGHNDRALQRKMYNLGADVYLTKPCSWETLWPIIQRYLELAVV